MCFPEKFIGSSEDLFTEVAPHKVGRAAIFHFFSAYGTFHKLSLLSVRVLSLADITFAVISATVIFIISAADTFVKGFLKISKKIFSEHSSPRKIKRGQNTKLFYPLAS